MCVCVCVCVCVHSVINDTSLTQLLYIISLKYNILILNCLLLEDFSDCHRNISS